MVFRVVPCVPWQLLRLVAGLKRALPASIANAALEVGSTDVAPNVAALANALEKAARLLACTPSSPPARGNVASPHALAATSHIVRDCLRSIVGHLEVRTAPGPGVGKLVLQLLVADVPERLVMCLDTLDFEARKDAMRAFTTILRAASVSGTAPDMQGEVSAYMCSRPQIARLLLDGCGRTGVFSPCAHMLRSYSHHPQLVAALLEEGVAGRLIDLAQHENFDVASEAFSSLRELLTAHAVVSAAYMTAHFAEFFELFHALLQVEDYVTCRQALGLLVEMLLHSSFLEIMVAYVDRERFLQIHMNLLRHSSRAIQLEAFHVFKIFVANPSMPRRVCQILVQNRGRLLRLVEAWQVQWRGDKGVAQDLQIVQATLGALEHPTKQAVATDMLALAQRSGA